MSNPNSIRFFAEDDEDNKSAVPQTPKRPTKPLKVNDNLINFSLNRRSEEQAQRAYEENKHATKDEESKESTTSSTTTPKRKQVGRSLRGLLTRADAKDTYPVQTTETNEPSAPTVDQINHPEGALPDSEAEVDELDGPADFELDPTLALDTNDVGTDVEADQTPMHAPNQPFAGIAANMPPSKVAAVPTATTMAPNTPNAPPAPPSPPRPPGATNFGGAPGGGGNLPPTPVMAHAANSGPANPIPITPNQAPVIVERHNNSGPAWLAFLGATYFRRRGERRINRKIDKTNDNLKQTQIELSAEKRARQAHQHKHPPIPAQNRYGAPSAPATASTNRVEGPPVYQAEQHPGGSIAQLNSYPTESSPAGTGTVPIKAAEIFAASPLAKEILEREVAQTTKTNQAEQAKAVERQVSQVQAKTEKQTEKIVQETVKEAGFDSRHEVKDAAAKLRAIPNTPNASGFNPGGPMLSPAHAVSSAPRPQPSSVPEPSVQLAAHQQKLYKQSLQAGAAVGISVIVLGLIAYLVF